MFYVWVCFKCVDFKLNCCRVYNFIVCNLFEISLVVGLILGSMKLNFVGDFCNFKIFFKFYSNYGFRKCLFINKMYVIYL